MKFVKASIKMVKNFAICRWAIWPLFLLVFLGCSESDNATRPSALENIEIHMPRVYADKMASTFQNYHFPLYPNVIRMHEEKIQYDLGEHFAWEAFACFSPPKQVVDYYREKLGEKAFTATKNGGMWRIIEARENDAHKIIRMLEVISAENHGLPDCHVPEQTKSIIIIATMVAKSSENE